MGCAPKPIAVDTQSDKSTKKGDLVLLVLMQTRKKFQIYFFHGLLKVCNFSKYFFGSFKNFF